MSNAPDLPFLLCKDQAAFAAWLDKNHGNSAGVWLKFAKKNSGAASVTYDEALDVALCYGWIDGQSHTFDNVYYAQRFTPRRPRSVWSQRNVRKVAELTKLGRMQPSGLAAVEEAKRNGRWDTAYGSSTNLEIPPELAAAFRKHPAAKKFFDTLTKTNQFAFCWRVHTAVKPETKQTRTEKFISMLEHGEKLH